MPRPRFIGEVQVEWLHGRESSGGRRKQWFHRLSRWIFGRIRRDDRLMRVLAPFSFVDRRGTEWLAPAGSIVDGASIPRFFWRLADPFIGAYRRASVIHDVMCKHRPCDSWEVHRMFREAMICDCVPKWKAWTMWAAVRLGGPKWRRRIKLIILLIVPVTLASSGCAPSQARANSSVEKVELRGGVVATPEPPAYVTFGADKYRCGRSPCYITLKVKIVGPINWCPTALRWVYDDGHFGGEHDSNEQGIGDCTQRSFSALRLYSAGKHRANVSILSGDAVVVEMKPIEIEVGLNLEMK